ncbi:MAG: hypothetical protein AB2733_18090 [Candidatus Thiodiazotropha taylori]
MNMKIIMECIREALSSIKHPRYYDTERGFQGALLAEINKKLPELELEGAIIEEEYQKRIRDHGFKIRPDLIIHVPFDYSNLESRKHGNFVVIELKRQATVDEALDDYRKLTNMCKSLDYPLGIFINISSDTSHLSEYEENDDPRIHSFAVELKNENVHIVEDQ